MFRLRPSSPNSRPLAPWLHALRLLAIAVPVLWVVQHTVLGASGFIALRQKHQQVQRELGKVKALEARNRDLNSSIRQLSSDPSAIEGIAREQLHLTRPGEIVYTYPTAPAPSGAAAADLR